MDAAEPYRLTIDIYSDVMCPWCAIGYGQLARALEELGEEVDAQLRWRAFELNPDMSGEGEEQGAHLRRKYGRSPEQARLAQEQMKALALEAGVSLAYEGAEADPASEGAQAPPATEEAPAPPAMMWNTRKAHMLLTFALEEAGPKVQTVLKLAMFKAHFNHRKNMGDEGVLLDLAAQAGLHREAARAALRDDELEERVAAEQRAAWDLNISGVPAMIVSGVSGAKFLIPGAQSPPVYVNALRRAVEKRI